MWLTTIVSGFFFAVLVIGGAFITRSLITQGIPGDRSVYLNSLIKDPFYPGRIMLGLLCFPALLISPRAAFTYYSTATFLALLVGGTIANAMNHVKIPPLQSSQPLWIMAIAGSALFCEFSFSRSSREFFGFLDPKEDSVS